MAEVVEVSWAAQNPLAFGILITFTIQVMFWLGYLLGLSHRQGDDKV